MAGTVPRRWIGNGGGRRWGPGVRSLSVAASLQKVSGVHPGETDVGGAQIEYPAAETDVGGAQIAFPVAETDVGGAQIEYSVAETGSGDAQWDALGTAVGRAAGRAVGLGRRAKRSQVHLERTEAGSSDSFGNDAFLSCRIESPSSQVARVTSALHNLCLVHSSSIPAHNSHARMPHARCVVNSVGDTEDGGRLSCVYGGTKSMSTSTRTGVRRSAVDESAHTQQTPLKLHVETWEGLLCNQGPKIFREVEIVPGCAVRVACPSCPDYYPEPPGPGIAIRNMLGWLRLEKTERSGVWVFRGALQGENLFSSLDVTGDWVRKGSYHTAWAVPCDSLCSCSYSYGQGPAIGPHTGRRCWPLLECVWRAIAPLMKPWCAEEEVPTAANLNLYRGGNSCVGWHRDDELLFGEFGEAKLIVSVSLGNFALFRWRRRFCPDDEGHLCCLHHGDILVMDGRCQDKFLHRTDPCRKQERINITFRWIKQHVSSCPLCRTGVACCLPTCAQGLSVPVMVILGMAFFGVFWLLSCVLCAGGVLALLASLLHTRLGFLWCASCWTRLLDVVQWGHYLWNHWRECQAPHKIAFHYWMRDVFINWEPCMLALDGPVSMVIMHVWFIGIREHSGEIAGINNVRPLFLLFRFFCFVEILLNDSGV